MIHVAILTLITEECFQQVRCDTGWLLRRLQDAGDFKPFSACLAFANFSKSNIEIRVSIDASISVNHNISSQLGILVILRDKQSGYMNIMHLISSEIKRVYKSALGSTLLTFVHWFDIGWFIMDTLGALLDRKVDLTMYIGSPWLYVLCISLAHKT